ncbi:MAG: hypothetical protein AMXMBFR84_20500 [Candidatus Hydrogenedentota bacterium]
MLQIARNIALGNGFSTAAGTLPTNGTQPFATVLYSLVFYLVGSQRTLGVLFVLLLQFTGTATTAWMIYRLGAGLMESRRDYSDAPSLAACVWFSSPMTVLNTSNCLETWLYSLFVVAAFAMYWRILRTEPPFQTYIYFGFVLGLAFLARNDACLLILSFCVLHPFYGYRRNWTETITRVGQTCVMGLTSVAVSLPWLIFNLVRFGSIVPISGQAEISGVTFGCNLSQWPASLTEYAIVALAIPNRLYSNPLVCVACLLTLAAFTAFAIAAASQTEPGVRRLIGVFVLYGVLLSTFYGLFFGAGHFMGRYLFPLSPFMAILWAVFVVHLLGKFSASKMRWAAGIVMSCVVVAVALQNIRIYSNGANQAHWQVVKWVQENAGEDAWIGAVQSGTLGYFHDRTINLDGKVNPEALNARLAQSIPAYVASSDITYLADWTIDEWMRFPEISYRFEVVVKQRTPPLAVLRRKAVVFED